MCQQNEHAMNVNERKRCDCNFVSCNFVVKCFSMNIGRARSKYILNYT